MVDWKVYKITQIMLTSCYGGWLTFDLDGDVSYNNGNQKYINCKHNSPFSNWRTGDYIEIDNDQTRNYNSEHVFNSDIQVRLKYDRSEKERIDLLAERDYWKREYGKIEGERNDWKTKFNNKNIENEGNKQQLEQERRNLQIEKTKYNNEKLEWTKTDGQKDTKIAELKGKLETTETQNTELKQEKENLKRDRDLQVGEWKGKYEGSEKEVKKITDSLNNLQIESNNKDNQLKLKDEEIKDLLGQKGLSQEELWKLKIRFEKRNLEQFAAELKINLEQLNALSKSHEKLFAADKEHNQTNIDTQEANIAQEKQKLLDKEISITNIQEICEKCEKIAEFNWKLSQVNQTQLIDNNQEKDWTNINPNFTPELVQAWIKHGFTYQQCQEWINISAPEKQDLAIKEPAYYAWLRDMKKMKPEEVLNYGDSQELNSEYLKWYQEQEQQEFETKQEIPTNN